MTCSGEPRLMPELQPAARDQVGRAGVLRHVERVLVAHVDDGGADLDAARPRADRGEQRERRARAAARSGGRGSRRRPRPAPPPRPRARSTATARRTPCGPANTATRTNGRTTGNRCASWPVLDALRRGRAGRFGQRGPDERRDARRRRARRHSAASSSTSRTGSVGSAKIAVPTWTATAPTARKSSTSASSVTPPIATTGISHGLGRLVDDPQRDGLDRRAADSPP